MHEVATRSTYTTSSFFTLERHQERGRNLHNSLLEFLASKPTSSHSRTIHGASFVRMEKEKKKEKSTRVPINWPCPYPVSFARDLRGESSKNTQHVISRSGGFWIIRPISIIVYQYARLKVVNRFFSSKRKREGICSLGRKSARKSAGVVGVESRKMI